MNKNNLKKYLFCDIYLFTSFAVSALISFTAWANSWCSTKSTVHALWITKCRLTILSHVTFRALTDFILIAPAAVGTLFIAFRIRSFILKTQKKISKMKNGHFIKWCWSPKGFTQQFSDFNEKKKFGNKILGKNIRRQICIKFVHTWF